MNNIFKEKSSRKRKREWPQIKAKAMICNTPQVHKINVCGYLCCLFFQMSLLLYR